MAFVHHFFSYPPKSGTVREGRHVSNRDDSPEPINASVRTLRGKVARGYGHASGTLERARPLVSKRIGLSLLCAGTLNVRLEHDYQMQDQIVLAPHEVNNVDELVLQRCRIGGFRSVLVRPYREKPKPGFDSNPPSVLEIMSERHLRTALKLENDSVVEVEVEGDDEWWSKPDELFLTS